MPSVVNAATNTAAEGFSQFIGANRDVFVAEIYLNALPSMRFRQFATHKEELKLQPGMTLAMPKLNGIKRGGQLVEGVPMEGQRMSQSQITITVKEWGNAIMISELLTQTSHYDQMLLASVLLGRDVAVVSDIDLRDTLLANLNKVYGDGSVSARADVTPAMTFGPKSVYASVSRLETKNAPKIFNDYYVCIFHPHQLSSMRQSPGWVNAQMYANSDRIFSGEVGRWNDVRFISTSHCPNGFAADIDPNTGEYADAGYKPELASGFAGNQTVIYQAVIFGQFSYGLATAVPVGLRDNGVRDFGREHGIAWYGIWGSGLLDTNNSIIVETAGSPGLGRDGL